MTGGGGREPGPSLSELIYSSDLLAPDRDLDQTELRSIKRLKLETKLLMRLRYTRADWIVPCATLLAECPNISMFCPA